MKLSGPAKLGLAQQGAHQREHAPLAILVGRDRIEDRRQPIRRLAVERQRRREQLRHLHVVERGRQTLHDRHAAFLILFALQHLDQDVRIELCGGGRQVADGFRQLFGRHHRDDIREMAERGEDGGRL